MESKDMLGNLTAYCHENAYSLSPKQRYAIAIMTKCRTSEMGGQVLECPDCGTKVIQYNPCNKRGCPICNVKSQVKWLATSLKRTLPTRHYHLTFSIPSEFARIWLGKKSDVAESLFVAVKAAIRQVEGETGLLLGSLLVFQSHGAGMSYKPHIHCMLSDGGLDANGKYVRLGNVPIQRMETVFGEVFRSDIIKRIGKTDEEVREAGSNHGYRVYVGIHEGTGKHILEYLAKKRFGVVVDIEKEVRTIDTGVEIVEATSTGEQRVTQLSMATFVERYINHIPPERFVVARYCGLYSNRHKDDYKKARDQITAEPERVDDVWWERCPVCDTDIKVVLRFKKEEVFLLRAICKTSGPPEHGFIIYNDQ